MTIYNHALYDKHHCIPRSRWKDFSKYNLNESWNIKILRKDIHRLHHQMWLNLTPWEIQTILKSDRFQMPNEHFFDAWKKVYGYSADKKDVLLIIVEEWTPILPSKKGKRQ
jgi:hypothetical protein